MNTIIDLYNKLLVYNDNNISFIIDKSNIIWFKLADITDILEYKSRKDVIRDILDKKYRKHLRDIETIADVDRTQPNTVYINESGLYQLVLKSKKKLDKEFKTWLIEDALPKLRNFGYYEIDDKTKNKIKNLNHKISLLTKSNNKLKKNMTKNKYPNGLHFYVLKDEGMYKIGQTKNLNKRLSTYNTGKANKAEYSYYKKTDCAKEIEECMKSLLNEYIYKSNKEFYKCGLNKILIEVRKCLKIEKNCKSCKDIQKGGGDEIENKNDIILSLLNDFEKERDELVSQYIIK
jgi:prophage antirepressor-like protein